MGSLRTLREHQLLVPGWRVFNPQDVPYEEYAALVSLYDALGGPNWTDKTSWLTDPTINNWYGVTVAGGHVTQIVLNGNNLAGNIGDVDWDNLTALILLNLSGNGGVDGDVTNLSILTSLQYLFLYTDSVSGGTIGTLVALRDCRMQNCGWNQATVDALLLDIYTERANFTYATPVVNVGADNSVPSGVYQDGDPPTTGLEYVFELANDPEVEGFNTWTITYNGGVAP